MKFFSPTPDLKELLLLQHIEKNPDTTQKEIARVIDGAPSMVNVYIDNLEKQNYMIRDYKSAKMVYYNITPEGLKRKNFLSITYLHELLGLYHLAKENIEKFLTRLEDKGYKNILFYGAGEVADTILKIARKRANGSLKILALVDDDSASKSKKNSPLGYRVISRDEIKDHKHDGIVITSYTFEDDIRSKLKEIDYPMSRVSGFFSEQ
ncbi:MAG: winged helix-turn-helix transcriptional regulator [Clostridium sp.]|nr:winged helix-turn-helix transcriptional regulator [Clostridium sp.]